MKQPWIEIEIELEPVGERSLRILPRGASRRASCKQLNAPFVAPRTSARHFHRRAQNVRLSALLLAQAIASPPGWLSI